VIFAALLVIILLSLLISPIPMPITIAITITDNLPLLFKLPTHCHYTSNLRPITVRAYARRDLPRHVCPVLSCPVLRADPSIPFHQLFQSVHPSIHPSISLHRQIRSDQITPITPYNKSSSTSGNSLSNHRTFHRTSNKDSAGDRTNAHTPPLLTLLYIRKLNPCLG